MIVLLSIYLAGLGGFFTWFLRDPKFRLEDGSKQPLSLAITASVLWPIVVILKVGSVLFKKIKNPTYKPDLP